MNVRSLSRRLRVGSVLVPLILFSAVARLEAQTVTLAWDPSSDSDVAGYVIGYGTAPGADNLTMDVGQSTAWTVGGLQAGVTYYFRVYAYNTRGLRSGPSNEVSTGAPGGTTCATSDPFVAMGGGTCYDGSWFPPGMTIPGTSTTSPTPQPTASVGTCSTPDPFTAMGGGTCYNGDWFPPGMTIPGMGTTSPPPQPTAPVGTQPTVSVGFCSTPDPFTALGGGTCYNGNWFPPGMVIPGATATQTVQPVPAVPPGSCSTPDPFVAIPGLIGLCVEGNWLPVAGVSTTGTVLFDQSRGFWTIRGDDGTIYRPLSDLPSSVRQSGFPVAFQARIAGEETVPPYMKFIEMVSVTPR